MKIVNHRCPTCGGSMKYDDKKRLVCGYCGFVKLEVLVNNAPSSIPNYFCYECDSCRQHIILKNESKNKILCPSCGKELSYRKILMNSFLDCDLSLDEAKSCYLKEIKEFCREPLFLPKEFYSPNFVLRYIKTVRYSGVLFLEYNSRKVRYIFKDIIFPFEKDFSYFNLLKFSTKVINNQSVVEFSNRNQCSFVGDFGDDKNFSGEQIINMLEEACIDDFMHLVKCSDKDKININNAIKALDYVYVPFYHAEIHSKGNVYNNYICGYTKNCKKRGSAVFYFRFPKIDEKLTRLLTVKGIFSVIIRILCMLFFICLYLFLLYEIGFFGIVAFVLLVVVDSSILKLFSKPLGQWGYVKYNKDISREAMLKEMFKRKDVIERVE